MFLAIKIWPFNNFLNDTQFAFAFLYLNLYKIFYRKINIFEFWKITGQFTNGIEAIKKVFDRTKDGFSGPWKMEKVVIYTNLDQTSWFSD